MLEVKQLIFQASGLINISIGLTDRFDFNLADSIDMKRLSFKPADILEF